MSTRRLVIAITFLSLFAMAARVSMQNDTWWHLASARWMVEHRQILDTDYFSYTRYGQTWEGVQVNWVGQLILYGVYRLGGPAGLNLLVAGVVTLAYATLYRTLEGGAFFRAFALILSAAAAGVFWAARTNLFSFLFFALFLRILEDWRWGRSNRLWLLPVLQIAWANTHSAYFAGIILAGLYGLAEALKWLWAGRGRFGRGWLAEGSRGNVGRFLLLGAALVAATCLTPLGLRTLAHPFDTVGIQVLQTLIDEWQPLDPRQWHVQPTLWLMALLVLGAIRARGRVTLSDALVCAFWGWQALAAVRNIPFFALALLPMLARLWWLSAGALARRAKFQPLLAEPQSVPTVQARLNLFLLGLVALAVVLKVSLVLPAEINLTALRAASPFEAVEYMKESPPEGRLFNSYNFGGYLIWALPEMPVFADGRTELFGDEILGQWLTIVGAGADWEELLARWEINSVLVEPHWPLVNALREAGWRVLYEDDVSVLLGR
ncbi:MAG: hypothetical protein HYZ26_07490 [Chloroflexi bacterium]|nr:hypothetical protein [Chloroflexota bacterium]